MSKTATLLWVIPVSFLYVFLAGYKGVVVSNLIQMMIFTIGTLALALLTLAHFGGPSALAQQLMAEYGMAGAEMIQFVPPVKHDVFPLAAA
jgi:Na+/proline symporter